MTYGKNKNLDIKNGLVMANANIYYEQTYLGLILLLAVSLAPITAWAKELKRRRKFRSDRRR